MAMMGSLGLPVPLRAAIIAVASNPSISGIWQSINTNAYLTREDRFDRFEPVGTTSARWPAFPADTPRLFWFHDIVFCHENSGRAPPPRLP